MGKPYEASILAEIYCVQSRFKSHLGKGRLGEGDWIAESHMHWLSPWWAPGGPWSCKTLKSHPFTPPRAFQRCIKLLRHSMPMQHRQAGISPRSCSVSSFQRASSQGEASPEHAPKQAAGNGKFSASSERLRVLLQCP